MKTPVRIGSILLMATLLVGAMATPALAWANGSDGPDSYGTHDWILDRAIEAAGEDASRCYWAMKYRMPRRQERGGLALTLVFLLN